MGFTGLTGFYWVLLGFTRFHWVLMGFNGLFGVSPSITGFYWVLLGLTGLYGMNKYGCVLSGQAGLILLLLGYDCGLLGRNWFFPFSAGRRGGRTALSIRNQKKNVVKCSMHRARN